MIKKYSVFSFEWEARMLYRRAAACSAGVSTPDYCRYHGCGTPECFDFCFPSPMLCPEDNRFCRGLFETCEVNRVFSLRAGFCQPGLTCLPDGFGRGRCVPCCDEMTPQCQACKRGLTVEQYCAANFIPGCIRNRFFEKKKSDP